MKTTLLATTGMSPAIVTETLWALAQQTPPVLPDFVEIITTKKGSETADKALNTRFKDWQDQTVWETLRQQLGAAKDQLILRPVQCIHITDGDAGRTRDLDDIRTPEENSAAAEFIFSRVWNVVRDKDQSLIASIAGGRKTMGALLHAAVTLIGRENDMLTHILVNDPFDTMRGFFFPSQPGGKLKDWSGNEHSPEDAHPRLAEVPFVPLRNRFKELDDLPGSFIALKNKLSSQLARDAAPPVPIRIDYNGNHLHVGGLHKAKVSISHLSLLHFVLSYNQIDVFPSDQTEAGEQYNLWTVQNTATFGEIAPIFKEDDFRKKLSYLRRTILKDASWQPGEFGEKEAPFRLEVIVSKKS